VCIPPAEDTAAEAARCSVASETATLLMFCACSRGAGSQRCYEVGVHFDAVVRGLGRPWLQRHRSCLATSSRSRSQEPPIPRGWTWAPTCYRTVGDPSIARSIRCCRPCDAWLRWLAPRRLDLHCRTVFEVSSLMLSLYSWSCWMDE
jgi:hypothetical protein